MNGGRRTSTGRGTSTGKMGVLIEESKSYRIFQGLELLLVAVLILIAWGLISLPTVFFYYSPDDQVGNIMLR